MKTMEALTETANQLISQKTLDTTTEEIITEILTQLEHPDTQIIFTAEQRQLMMKELHLWLEELATS